ncbi:DUF664 domain-containing protein [Blastococcus sp. SYSU D00669]
MGEKEVLRQRRDDLLGKLDGLDEYDVRRPLTPTLGYLGDVFGRPGGRAYPWDDGGEPDADMWATAAGSRADVVEVYRFSAAHADATVEALPLDAVGTVPWWPEDRRRPTLHTVLVHLTAEVARHAGHADVLRELIDGAVGTSAADTDLPDRSAGEWAAYRARIEAAAGTFRRA